MNRAVYLIVGSVALVVAVSLVKRRRELAAADDGEASAWSLPLVDDALELANTARSMLLGDGMSISIDGLDAIRAHEGFRSTVYLDQAGRPTIGYGHLIGPLETFDGPISEDQALELLAGDVRTAEEAVNAAVAVPLTQAQYDALVSLAYNIGTGAFRGSTLLKKLNAGDYDGAAAQFGVWNKVTINGAKVASAGLSNRRAAEAALFSRTA